MIRSSVCTLALLLSCLISTELVAQQAGAKPSKAQRALDRAQLDLEDLVEGLGEAAKFDAADGKIHDVLDEVGDPDDAAYRNLCAELRRIRNGLKRHQKTRDAKAQRMIERLRIDLDDLLKDCPKKFLGDGSSSPEEVYAKEYEAVKKVLDKNFPPE